MAKIYQIYSNHKKDYDVFQVRKCGIESLKNTIEIPRYSGEQNCYGI